ncbi:MAG: biopolymer transporter ExbD [Verrucomicrobiota bacterium]
MKRFSDRYKRDIVNDLNVTPLIDLAFTLLIIFMIATPLIEQQMEVELPKASTADPIDTKDVHFLSINKSGQILLDKKLLTKAALETALLNLKNQNPRAVISLRADMNTKYEAIVYVFDAVRKADIKVGLATLPDQS